MIEHSDNSQGTRPDDRRRGERRRHNDRRAAARLAWGQPRVAPWPEQQTQFFTRYFFVLIAFAYFNFSANSKPAIMPLAVINAFYFAHFLFNTWAYFHAKRQLAAPWRFRLALWVDIVGLAVAVVNDPYQTPPSLIAYILVVLGNGMRYGMGLFIEAIVGSLLGAVTALGIRHAMLGNALTPGVLFLFLFFVVILGYAYILVRRNEQTRSQLEHHSLTDALTGLTNRRGLFELSLPIFQYLRASKDERVAVMFCDLDKFKAINDNLGHAVGDRVLKQLGEILRSMVRTSDIAARYGGDEFVLVLNNTTLDQAEAIGQRIQARIAAWAKENGLDCSATIALAEAPTHGDELSVLLSCADQALYHSKQNRGPGGVQRVQRPSMA
jgi:diguanylate cyclase (GGDEF)-like protein